MRIRYCIDLDKELHKRCKVKAIDKEISMRTLMVEALTSYLKEDDEAICDNPDCPLTLEHEHTSR